MVLVKGSGHYNFTDIGLYSPIAESIIRKYPNVILGSINR